MKKRIALILSMLMLLSLCACGKKPAVEETTTLTDDGLYPAVTAAVNVEIQNLLPTNGNGNPKIGFYWNIYESLFDFNADLDLMPDLAKGYEIVDDTHWRVQLFEKIYDSAGNHITADDVVFSVKWLRDKGEDINYDIFESVKAIDAYTVEYTWKKKPASSSDIEFPLVRTFIFSEAAFNEVAFATKPVATGNYTVKEFITGSKLVLAANPEYWALKTDEDVSMRLGLHKATVKELTYEIIQESATAQVALQTDKIDYCDYIRAVSLPEFENDDRFVVDINYSSDYSFLAFNMDESNLLANDLNLRLAICHALDSEAIAESMPGSYTGMKTYGTPWFSDFDPAWEADPNYCNTTDGEKAKEYLAASGYAAAGSPELVLISKSVEVDRNAVQMIMAQLMNIGINIKLKPVDASTFQTDTGSADNFDLIFFNPMGGKNLVSSWKLALGNVGNKNSNGKDGSLTWNTDEKLFELYDVATADATHTSENMKAVIDYVFENAYVYPVAYSVTARIYDKNVISSLYFREGNATLPATTYVGQPQNVDPVVVKEEAPAVDYSGAAGEYTFTEIVGEGSGTCEYKLTLNADGTYRLDQHNMYGEDVFIEGTFTMDKATVVCAAPEAGVQGPMDRLLNSGWADRDKPASNWLLNSDGTATPVGYEPPAPTEASADEPEEPGILKGLANMGFDRFDFYEEVAAMNTTFPWHVLIKNGDPLADGTETGECIIVVQNANVGTDDGLLVYHCTFTKKGPNLTSSTPEESEAELPRLGAFWNEDGSIDWQLFGPGRIVPAKLEGLDAYIEAVNAGEIPAKAEAPAEEPGILKGLANMGFDRFDFYEEVAAMNTTFPWHVLIKNADPLADGTETGECIIVVQNANVGTDDGLLVYHCTFTKKGPNLTSSTPEESEAELPRLGAFWNEDGSIDWQLFGPGRIVPAKLEGLDAYIEAVNAGKIPAKAEAPAEEPGILKGLANMGFDRFDWTEDVPGVGKIPWHLHIKNGDPTPEGLEAGEYVLVVQNPNLGTPDGLLVYHGTFTKDKATVNLSTPEESEDELKRLGGMWNTDGTSVWTISGPGQIAPEDATK